MFLSDCCAQVAAEHLHPDAFLRLYQEAGEGPQTSGSALIQVKQWPSRSLRDARTAMRIAAIQEAFVHTGICQRLFCLLPLLNGIGGDEDEVRTVDDVLLTWLLNGHSI